MDCREILKVYQLYVDDEIDNSSAKMIKKHTQACPDCQYRLKFELRFQSTITRKVQSKTQSAPEELKKKIKRKIF